MLKAPVVKHNRKNSTVGSWTTVAVPSGVWVDTGGLTAVNVISGSRRRNSNSNNCSSSSSSSSSSRDSSRDSRSGGRRS